MILNIHSDRDVLVRIEAKFQICTGGNGVICHGMVKPKLKFITIL